MTGDDGERLWLDEQETEAWVVLSGLMVRLPSVLDAQLQRAHQLSMFEYFVLAGLSHAPDRKLRMSELALIVNGSQSRLSNVVKKLEQRGAVRREPDQANARYTIAVLTEMGFDLLNKAAPSHARTVRHYVFDALTRQHVRELAEIGRRILRQTQPDSMWPWVVTRQPGSRSS